MHGGAAIVRCEGRNDERDVQPRSVDLVTLRSSLQTHCNQTVRGFNFFGRTYLRNVDGALPKEKLGSGVRDMHRPER